MKRKSKRVVKVQVEEQKTRYQPDPHRRNRVIENKKIYSRKAQPSKAGPFDCLERAKGLEPSTVDLENRCSTR